MNAFCLYQSDDEIVLDYSEEGESDASSMVQQEIIKSDIQVQCLTGSKATTQETLFVTKEASTSEFGESFFEALEHQFAPYSPSQVHSDTSDCFSPSPKRRVIELPTVCTSDLVATLARPVDEVVCNLPVAANKQNVFGNSSKGTKRPRKKYPNTRKYAKRIPQKVTWTYLSTPPWFLDVSLACFTCKKHMMGDVSVHLAHKPVESLFESTPFLTRENATKWAQCFDLLVTQCELFFQATSRANLLEILSNKVAQAEKPAAWSDPMKRVLTIFHAIYFDAVLPEDVKFSPPNSVKVLADEAYCMKVLMLGSKAFRKKVNKIC